ncbi:pseudouridine synthase [Murdochiella massiliensis]|uniref:pseudouridine synthase n=1 Tax=Murdochiella massiliensis TaxID=1673723 RepID=UPI00096AD86C|nr:pseudouridine synthase [Murdochiella massiliensis]
MVTMRLDKWLSHQGLGSRREVNALIRSGRVQVNGKVVTIPKTAIAETDLVQCDTQAIRYQQYVYFLLHKPKGVLSATRDRRQTVLDLLRPEDRLRPLFPVGRLDRDTTGLVLLTDDGRLAHALLSPRRHVEKEYFVEVDIPIDETLITRFAEGILLQPENILTRPAQLSMRQDGRASVIITEGKYHQVKRMFSAGNRTVLSLHRHRMGPLELDDDLAEGQYRPLNEEEIEQLRIAAGQRPEGA